MRVIGIFFLIGLVCIGRSSTAAAQMAPPFSLSPPRGSPPVGQNIVRSRVATIPLPRERPVEAGPRMTIAKPEPAPAAAPEPEPGAPAEPAPPSECFLTLTADIAEIQQLPPIAEPNGCEAQDVVRLDAVMMPDRRRIPLSPPAVLRCSMATAIAKWVREDLQSLMMARGGALTGLDNFNSFECRGRNRVVGARTSEHGRANALDIRGVLVNGGRKIEFTNPEVPRDLREALKASVCRRFTTVLGPGSDGYHEDHVHIDLAERRGGYRLCQWEVRDVEIPLPRERPVEAGPREP